MAFLYLDKLPCVMAATILTSCHPGYAFLQHAEAKLQPSVTNILFDDDRRPLNVPFVALDDAGLAWISMQVGNLATASSINIEETGEVQQEDSHLNRYGVGIHAGTIEQVHIHYDEAWPLTHRCRYN